MQCEKSVNLLVRLQPICWFETLSAAGTQLRDRWRKTMYVAISVSPAAASQPRQDAEKAALAPADADCAWRLG